MKPGQTSRQKTETEGELGVERENEKLSQQQQPSCNLQRLVSYLKNKITRKRERETKIQRASLTTMSESL